MSPTHEPGPSRTRALEQWSPGPGAHYGLDDAARIACVPRRTLLVYWRAGLVTAVLQPPYGVVEFAEESLRGVRRMERLRAAHGFDLAMLGTLVALVDELERMGGRVRRSGP